MALINGNTVLDDSTIAVKLYNNNECFSNVFISKHFCLSCIYLKVVVMSKFQINQKLAMFLLEHLCIYYKEFLECSNYLENWSKRPREILLTKT